MHEFRVPEQLPAFIQDHVRDYLETDGEIGHHWDSTSVGGNGLVTTLLLVTVGRKSGRIKTLPIGYTKTDVGYIIVGSKGGAPQHPAWYLNLVANPEVSVQVGSDRFDARARVLEGEARQAVWDSLVKETPQFQSYQDGIDRQIPVVVLERV
jgi:deazaflavin-dependent oxidoreductase (nitroreductase family)